MISFSHFSDHKDLTINEIYQLKKDFARAKTHDSKVCTNPYFLPRSVLSNVNTEQNKSCMILYFKINTKIVFVEFIEFISYWSVSIVNDVKVVSHRC